MFTNSYYYFCVYLSDQDNVLYVIKFDDRCLKHTTLTKSEMVVPLRDTPCSRGHFHATMANPQSIVGRGGGVY